MTTVEDLVSWLREQIEATLLLPWHLPDCQMLKPVPEGLTRTIIGDTFSCNCDLTTARLSEYEAHTAILDAVQRHIDGHPGPCTNEGFEQDADCELHSSLNETALEPYAARLLAVAYKHRPGYRQEWRP